MHVFSWPTLRDVRLPAICARCGATPLGGYRLRGGSGVVRVPLCAPCHRRSTRALVAWVLGALSAAAIAMLLFAVMFEVLWPRPPQANVTIVSMALIACGGSIAYVALRRRAALFRR